MSDQFDSLFDGLRGQSPPIPFAPAESVRRRGRQRAHRQVAAVGFAVLAVTGLGAGGIATAVTKPDPAPAPPAATGPATPSAEPTESVPSPTPTPTPSAESTGPPSQAPPSPSADATQPSTIPEDWLLVGADLGGDGWARTSNEMLEGAWYWDGSEAWCPEYRTEDYPSVQRRIDAATVGWQRPGEPLERVDQLVELFEPGTGAENMRDVRAYIELCSREPTEGDEVAPIEYEIEDAGFAEDQSLLIRVQQYYFNEDGEIVPGEDHYVAVVRVRDAVTTIVYRAGGDVHQVAQSAAARMR